MFINIFWLWKVRKLGFKRLEDRVEHLFASQGFEGRDQTCHVAGSHAAPQKLYQLQLSSHRQDSPCYRGIINKQPSDPLHIFFAGKQTWVVNWIYNVCSNPNVCIFVCFPRLWRSGSAARFDLSWGILCGHASDPRQIFWAKKLSHQTWALCKLWFVSTTFALTQLLAVSCVLGARMVQGMFLEFGS